MPVRLDHYRMNQEDIDGLSRAREILDSIYDCVVGMNTQAKPLLVHQLRIVHATVYELEKKSARRKLHYLVRRGVLKPEDLPEWARTPEFFPETNPAAPKEE